MVINMKTISDFYCGSFHPADKYVIKDSKYMKISEKTEKLEREILSSPEGEKFKPLIRDIEELNCELMSITDEESFEEGMRFGIKLMCDVFYGKSENFKAMGE